MSNEPFPRLSSTEIFSESFYKNDPDIIVGHEFLGESLDVLVHRMKELKVSHWSRIGRFRRDKWPNIGKQGSNIKFLAGRLLCDLSSDAAKVRPEPKYRIGL